MQYQNIWSFKRGQTQENMKAAAHLDNLLLGFAGDICTRHWSCWCVFSNFSKWYANIETQTHLQPLIWHNVSSVSGLLANSEPTMGERLVFAGLFFVGIAGHARRTSIIHPAKQGPPVPRWRGNDLEKIPDSPFWRPASSRRDCVINGWRPSGREATDTLCIPAAAAPFASHAPLSNKVTPTSLPYGTRVWHTPSCPAKSTPSWSEAWLHAAAAHNLIGYSIDPLLFWCWTSVVDGGPASKQQRVIGVTVSQYHTWYNFMPHRQANWPFTSLIASATGTKSVMCLTVGEMSLRIIFY